MIICRRSNHILERGHLERAEWHPKGNVTGGQTASWTATDCPWSMSNGILSRAGRWSSSSTLVHHQLKQVEQESLHLPKHLFATENVFAWIFLPFCFSKTAAARLVAVASSAQKDINFSKYDYCPRRKESEKCAGTDSTWHTSDISPKSSFGLLLVIGKCVHNFAWWRTVERRGQSSSVRLITSTLLLFTFTFTFILVCSDTIITTRTAMWRWRPPFLN